MNLTQGQWWNGTTTEDPRDITIRTLKAEVERLAGDLELASSRLEGEGQGGRFAGLSAAAARALLARLAVFAFLALLSLPGFAAERHVIYEDEPGWDCHTMGNKLCGPGAGTVAARHVTRPISAITVKVVSHQDFARKLASRPGAEAPGTPWIITSHDIDSCVAWVDTRTGDVSGSEIAALRACRKLIDANVDAAASRSGV